MARKTKLHPFRTHTCGELRLGNAGIDARLSGWVHRKRDHGNLLFIDLRDHYGLTQVVIEADSPEFNKVEELKPESVITVTGRIEKRSEDTVNKEIPTGEVELRIDKINIESVVEHLPLQVAGDAEFPEDLRLRYRYIDLRRKAPHDNIVLRSRIISAIRRHMTDAGFLELQTPILTASSPEGARDYLVPSRIHPGKFYALPQAPQIFKQLIMVSGFDKYFQIAPCFRDEDARADRSPGEFYQLDVEMSFCTQDDIFNALELLLNDVFSEFGGGKEVTNPPFPRIPYKESMLKYGSDKPDLRNPLIIADVTEVFRDSKFSLFSKIVSQGGVVRAVPAPGAAHRPRSFFDKLNNWAREEGQGGLGYIIYSDGDGDGPIARNLEPEKIAAIKRLANVTDGDAVFFAANQKELSASSFAGLVRNRICDEIQVREKEKYSFCWITDYPMFEIDPDTGDVEFSHNPFSMPQGELRALETKAPPDILAHQYDIVCNGVELSSGAIRNHRMDIMYKVFEIAGYDKELVKDQFGALVKAFEFGAPPHGGSAPGIDRIVMLLAEEPNIREVILFPMNQQAEDLMMNAPAEISQEQFRELHIKKDLPREKGNVKSKKF